ncbi:ATP-binding protein [Streptomyces sp. NBS 14/10]|uniref:ATP-binding protein n=1 Tax=Streptomyces sp. NBS 14/10 TaxID=1945643 RepID=UPI002730D685|nr:ATP-binding protein [Streptomyces sp. NBS 14/10]KAK1176693.1 ATP-binding protein [Streptomyces sp. NBS 14/10]
MPREPEDLDRVPTRQIAAGAVATGFGAWITWGLLSNGYLGWYWQWPYLAIVPRSQYGSEVWIFFAKVYTYLVMGAVYLFFARLGRWLEAARRMIAWARRRGQPPGTPPRPRHQPMPSPDQDPAEWPELRAGGASEAADRLAGELRAGRMTDVDYARIARVWTAVQGRREGLIEFGLAVREHGAAAWPHGSGARDLPARTAHHDLTLGQVRIGIAATSERNPYEYRGVGVAVDPGLLGTSALAVGPPAVVAARLVRPVVESLCLQALAGQAAVISVTAADTGLSPDGAFDVVIRPGRPDSSHGLDLYGGAVDPDEAAGMVAEALVGDEVTILPGGDSRRAATVLAQLLGPYHAAYGGFPTLRDLRDLLDGSRPQLDALRVQLLDVGLDVQVRDLESYERQAAQPAGVAALLAERIALLDRPAFAGFFTSEAPPTLGAAPGTGEEPPYRPFSLQALEHPLRIRVDLPERGHAEASRIIARLVLAQFAQCATARRDQTRFAFLVLDDAAQVVTPQSLRSLQRLRSAHAGVMLALPALADVPEPLRGPLLGMVGCRAVCSGVTPWDGAHFAEAWGVEWVETRTVTAHEIRADEPLARAMHGLRRLTTGKAVTRESVTVKREQRQRWSASDLANEVPVGHAVVSLTSVSGERTPPILVKITD